MQLCDKDIYKALKKGDIVFMGTNEKYPFIPERQVQASTVDLRVGNRFLKFMDNISCLDFAIHNPADFMTEYVLKDGEALIIKPHQIVFAQTYEQVYMCENIAGRIEGRSRTARVGLAIHCTGSNMNPGFQGSIALQVMNCNDFSVAIYPYMDICQIMFYKLSDTPLLPFGFFNEPYQNEDYPAPSNLSSKSSILNDEDNPIIRKRAQSLLNSYLNSISMSDKPSDFDFANAKTMVNNYIQRIETFQYGDSYDAEMVGVQGKQAGKYANIEQSITENGSHEKTLSGLVLNELIIIHRYVTSHAEMCNSNVSKYIRESLTQIKNGDIDSAFHSIRMCGQNLLNIAKICDCPIVGAYLTSSSC